MIEVIETIIKITLFIIIIIFIISKKNKKEIKEMIHNIVPIDIELIDVLIMEIDVVDTSETKICPVLKSKKDNKVYISSAFDTIYSTFDRKDKSNPKVVTKSLVTREIINYGKEGKLYLKDTKSLIEIQNSTMLINLPSILGKTRLIYGGKYPNILKTGYFYNVMNSNILELLNGATVYYGVADFEQYGELEKYCNKII